MPEIFKKQIIKLLKHTDYAPLKLGQLAKAIGVSSEDYPQFKEAFDQLRHVGHVVIGARNLVSLPSLASQIVGTFRANPRGFGFVIPRQANTHGDLFIPPTATSGAMSGDIVIVKVKRKGKRVGQMRYSGEVIEVLERAQNKFVGTLLKHPEAWIVQPDGTSFIEPISVDDVGAKGAIRQYHLPGEFEEDCIEQAREAATQFNPEELNHRDDITDKIIITIDPPDAKDFDDAISLEKKSDGNWVLGVHIADVSHFIAQDSPLDAEAKDRGNSVYLPGKTIPMLPEILSNGICSLQPGQKRFVKSAYLTYDQKGNVVSRSFANSIMCSTQRLSYQQAEKVLKGRTKDTKPEVIDLLKNMEALSQVIEQRRRKNGMLHLDLPERELVMDKSGRVVDAHPADDSYPHTIIEMFMVEANDAVASLLDRLNVPFIRRIHPEPDALSMKNLAKFLRAFGFSLPRTPDRASIQDLLAAVKGADCSFAVNLAVLRSFEKAQYAPLHIGHFALASTHYCHFTSPIRRYADLLVHRALEYYLQKRSESARDISAELDLTEIGKHITFTEQRADDAEKELTTVLILQMLSKKIGEELDSVVTGLTSFGLFVQSRKFGIEGLIRMDDLGPDHWKYNARAQCIDGQRSGCIIRLGRAIKVHIVSVNVPARQLNVAPVELLTDTAKKIKKSKVGRKSKRRKRKT
jgi:ribonuclease R